MALTLKYDFATDKSLVAAVGPTLTCTRASDATYFDSSGVMQTASSNVARFDHNPATQESLGIRIEEKRTNLHNYSQNFNNWSKRQVSVNNASITAPDGTTTGNKITETTAYDAHRAQSSYSTTVGTTYLFTVFAKAGSRTFVATGGAGLWGNNSNAQYDLTDGIAYQPGSDTPDPATVKIQYIGNDWYRCTTKYKAKGTSAAVWQLYDVYVNGDPATAWGRRYTGDGSSYLYLWGSETVVGDFDTSYIPNLGTGTASREKDIISTTDVSWLG